MNNLWPLFLALLIFSSCKKKGENIAAESLTMDKGKADVRLGATLPLTATVVPDNTTSKVVTWNSSDPSIATVAEGLVTPLKEGETVISATAGGLTADCTVAVLPPPVAVAGISLNPQTVSLVIKKTSPLKAAIAPDNATDQQLVWSSDKEDIATVSDGVITARAPGTCTITVKSFSNQTKMDTCTVTVGDKEIPVTDISGTPASANILVNGIRQLTVNFVPKNTTNKDLNWATSNTAIAEVSSDGLVTAKSVGSAIITVTSASNAAKTATCTITVTNRKVAVTDLSTAPADTTVTAGTSFQLRHSIMPANATNITVTYEAGEAAKALVSESGLVTAGATGQTTITVKSLADPTKMATCRLTIRARVENITVSPDALTLSVGQKHLLTSTVMPSNAADKTVAWSSADESKATISNEGEVTALAPGLVRLIAAPNDKSGITGEAVVTVLPLATFVTMAPENPAVLKAETLELRATLFPAEAAQSVTWCSGDPAIATIDPATGIVTGIETGTTLITATAADGSGVKTEVTLTVQNNPKASNVSLTAITLGTENFVVSIPHTGAATTLNNAPRSIASDLAEVQVNITATDSAIIKIGTTIFLSGQKVNFTHSVTFSVTEEGKTGSKEYTLTITPYHKASNPYGIYTAAHLYEVRNGVSAGYKLMNDITLPAANDGLAGINDYDTEGWLPIGDQSNPFTGSLDGAGYKIDNLYANRQASAYTGLFGKVGAAASIKNLGVNTVNEENRGVTGEDRTDWQYSGILAGLSEGTIEDCYTTGKVFSSSVTTGYAHAGGLLGYAGGQVRRCYSTAMVTGAATGGAADSFSGGLAGYNEGTLHDCYATGKVYAFGMTTHSTAFAGGLTGGSRGGEVSRCYATGEIYSQSAAEVNQKGAYAGGLLGLCENTRVNNCYALGKVTASTLVSKNDNYTITGGFAGRINAHSTISNSYCVGDVAGTIAKQQLIGGLVGYDERNVFTNCYRNRDASITSAAGTYDENAFGLTPEPLVDMKSSGFRDILNRGQSTVWGQSGGKNDNLPYLTGVGVGK